VVSVLAHKASDIKVMSSDPEPIFWSKCSMTKTLDLGHAYNSDSAEECKDVKTWEMIIFDGL
jgi:hypothetical protein